MVKRGGNCGFNLEGGLMFFVASLTVVACAADTVFLCFLFPNVRRVLPFKRTIFAVVALKVNVF